MSYCRFMEGDVYAYDSEGGVQFYVAGELDRSLDRLCRTYNEAYQYAKSLRDEHGLDVPDHAIEALHFDALEEAERISGPDGVVAELHRENAKLRSMVHDMRYCIKRNHRCDDCDFNVGTDCLLFVNINKRMRELGVEVDE